MYDIEEFRDVVGYEDLYEVSNEGRVRNKITGKIKKPAKDKDGYLRVSLYNKEVKGTYGVHRLVAKSFIPNPNNYPQINHIDENKSNNSADNLEWCDCQYNIRYSAYKKNKPVNQYALDGRLLNTYESIKEASEKTGIDNGDISNCCLGKPHHKTAGGYIWKHESK